MGLIKLNLYPLRMRRRSQNCIMEILSAPSTLIFNFEAPFETFHSAGLTHISCGILRKYVLRNSSQSKKLKGNLLIGQLVSHKSKKATKANRGIEFSCSCRSLPRSNAPPHKPLWKAHGVGATVVSTNRHSIGSDCHWLFISGHEEITSDYRWYYPATLFAWRNNLPYMKHLPEDFSVFS